MSKHKTGQADGTMPLTGHLKELRNRLIISVLCLVAFFLVGLYFAPSIINILTDIGKQYGYRFVQLSPQELLLQQISVALVAGLTLSFPVILYHVWAFIQPGLKKNENSLFLGALISGLLFFVVGVCFAFKIMLPFMLRFLINLTRGTDVTSAVSISQYITFLLTIFLVMGIVFELPVVTVILTQLGLLRIEWMKKSRRIVIILIFLVAAIITPPDIVSQVMVAVPMLGLYELSILVCSILLKLKKEKHSENADEEDADDEPDNE